MTYSLIARDVHTGELGVAVQSHFLAVGALAPWIEPGVGAVATQAFVDPSYGPDGLALMRDGLPAPEALRRLADADSDRAVRQVAMLDREGRVDVFTGAACFQVAEHATAPGASAQGNMLCAPGTAAAMLDAFASASGDLAARLLAGLDAGQARGGDARGMQSAALLVAQGTRGGVVTMNCRVDDHPEPLVELRRLVELHRVYADVAVILRPGMVGGPPPSAADAADALAALARAEAALPGSGEPPLWRAVIAARSGQPEEARAAAARAVANQPSVGLLLARLQQQAVVPEATWEAR